MRFEPIGFDLGMKFLELGNLTVCSETMYRSFATFTNNNELMFGEYRLFGTEIAISRVAMADTDSTQESTHVSPSELLKRR